MTGRLTEDDVARLERIAKLMASLQSYRETVSEIHTYYYDADRADRTPRAAIYLHLGWLCGALKHVLDDDGSEGQDDDEGQVLRH